MPYFNDSSLANAGIYRQTLEQIMYSPPSEKTKKKEFHDETLASIKKVTKLVERFEKGKLEITIDESDLVQENKVPEKERDLEENLVFDEEEDVCDGPAMLPPILPPTPKARTKFAHSTPPPEREMIEYDGRFDQEDIFDEIIETPILRTPSRPASGVKKFTGRALFVPNIDTPFMVTPQRHNSGLRPAESQSKFANCPETPILRSMSRQVSGISLIDEHVKTSHLKTEDSPRSQSNTSPFRQKTLSSGSSDSASSSSSQNSGSQKATESIGSFNTNNRDYHSKLARAQVHNRFLTYYKWREETIRSIAAAVSKMRLDVLSEIPECDQDERMRNVMTIYENCLKGVNKEMDALCCSLFDLLDDVNEKALSVHEDYVAFKYRKKCEKNID